MKGFMSKLDLVRLVGVIGSFCFLNLFAQDRDCSLAQDKAFPFVTTTTTTSSSDATFAKALSGMEDSSKTLSPAEQEPSKLPNLTDSGLRKASLLSSPNGAYKEAPCCPSEVKANKINFRHSEGDGIGYKKGYSTTELFLSDIFTDQLIYFDGRGHFLNQGRWAFSAGGGYRGYYEPWDKAFGMNLFLDYRDTHHTEFYQMTIGLEYFGKTINLRSNAYLPLGKARKTTGISFGEFRGNHGYFRTDVQQAMWGLDAEIEGKCYSYKKMDLDLSLRGYLLRGTQGRFTLGAQGSASAIFYDTFYLKGSCSYDDIFHLNAQGEVGLTFSFANPFKSKGSEKKKGCPSEICLKKDVAKRLTSLPSRLDLIVVSKAHGSKIMKDPNGVPYFFYHVDNTSVRSLGTAESPFQTLAEAQAASVYGEPIYVHYGHGTTQGMDFGIVLKEDQRFLGSGINHSFATQYGMRDITAQTPGLNPAITNFTNSIPVVTVANGSEVSGFMIVGSAATAGTGIQGLDLTRGVKISHNSILDNGATIVDTQRFSLYIRIADGTLMDGTLEITDNIFSQFISGTASFGAGIRFLNNGPTGANVNITNNRFEGLLNSGVLIWRPDAPQVSGELKITGDISHNIMEGLAGTGIHILNSRSYGSVNCDLRIEDNTISSDDYGILAERAAGNLYINNNTIFNNINVGIYVGILGADPAPLPPDDNLMIDIIGNTLYDNIGTNPGMTVRSRKGTVYLRLFDNICNKDLGADDYNLINANSVPDPSKFKVEMRDNVGTITTTNVQFIN